MVMMSYNLQKDNWCDILQKVNLYMTHLYHRREILDKGYNSGSGSFLIF